MQKNRSPKHIQSTSSHTETNSNFDLEQNLPNFQLRLDEHSDQYWIKTPVLSPDANVDLSPRQCEETFKLFLLSGERLSQMTRTYHDVDALMHLLEEKEKDLELAARIGQTLLTKNQQVNEKNEFLEEKLSFALEEARQLKHEISSKEQLLNIYEEAESNDGADDIISLNNLQSDVNVLNKKIQRLEQDKKDLLQEKCENNEHENRLVSTTVQKLSMLQEDLQTANTHILAVTDELTKRNGDASKQQNEVSLLLSQIKDLQNRHGQLINDHDDLKQQLSCANTSQVELSQEVQNLEVKYQEVLTMLDDTREEMRSFRDPFLSSEHDSLDFTQAKWRVSFDSSLAAELAESISTDNNESCNSPYESNKSQYSDQTSTCSHFLNKTFPVSNKKFSKVERSIFKTAQYIKKYKYTSNEPKISLSSSLPLSLQESDVTCKPDFSVRNLTPTLKSPDFGQPGVPGTTDLQHAIEKLTNVGKASLKFVQKTHHHLMQTQKSSNRSIKKCMSAPKLQIVKPLEGSLTLQQWKSLAEERSFSTTLKIPSSTSGVITRACISNSQKSEKKVEPSNSILNSFQSSSLIQNFSIFKPSCNPTGTSGVVLGSLETKQKCQSSVNIKSSKNLKSVHSSPYLPSLAAALVSPSTSDSVLHAASCLNSNSQSSSVDLAQLHGRENHRNPKEQNGSKTN